MKMPSLNHRLKPWLRKGDALSLRERVILFVLVLAGIWALMDALFLSPQTQARTRELERATAAQERIRKGQDLLAQAAAIVPADVAAKNRLDAARRAYEARVQAAGQLQHRLVAPKDMVRVLQGLTRSQPGLRLVSLQTHPPEPFPAPPKEQALTPQPPPGLYRHGVTLTLSGHYESLVSYMESLASLPVGFYWERARLDATPHPDIELTLMLNTLSLEREWLIL